MSIDAKSERDRLDRDRDHGAAAGESNASSDASEAAARDGSKLASSRKAAALAALERNREALALLSRA